MGMYAPITKPAAADKIPKKAPAADEDLKNRTILMNNALDERHPRKITAYAPRMLNKVRCIFPSIESMIRPAVKRSDVIKNEDMTAAVR